VDVAMVELSELSVTNHASDSDVPVQTLVYSLVDGPAGAAIDGNGVITWVPDSSAGPSTNIFVTLVGDGLAGATNSFTVTVIDSGVEFEIVSTTLTNGVASIAWNAVDGQQYVVEYTDALDSTNWISLLPAIRANGAVVTATNELSGVAQRFYRIRLGGD